VTSPFHILPRVICLGFFFLNTPKGCLQSSDEIREE
jgi:hypothetical protein